MYVKPFSTYDHTSQPKTQLELDDLNIENAYFRSFDAVVRRQLDPVWHKVGPKTKQLVSDLSTLRRLLSSVIIVAGDGSWLTSTIQLSTHL